MAISVIRQIANYRFYEKVESFSKDTRSSHQSMLSKNQTNVHSFPQFLNHIFLQVSRIYVSVFNIEYVLDQSIRNFFSRLHGRHQFPFPASKFRVLLAIWFGFLRKLNSFWSEHVVSLSRLTQLVELSRSEFDPELFS